MIVAAYTDGTQTTHTLFFFLMVSNAVIWPLPTPFKATTIKLAAFVLLGFNLCTYDERENSRAVQTS